MTQDNNTHHLHPLSTLIHKNSYKSYQPNNQAHLFDDLLCLFRDVLFSNTDILWGAIGGKPQAEVKIHQNNEYAQFHILKALKKQLKYPLRDVAKLFTIIRRQIVWKRINTHKEHVTKMTKYPMISSYSNGSQGLYII